jgi:hypothetical protein
VLVGTSEGRMAGEGDPRGRNGTSKWWVAWRTGVGRMWWWSGLKS